MICSRCFLVSCRSLAAPFLRGENLGYFSLSLALISFLLRDRFTAFGLVNLKVCKNEALAWIIWLYYSTKTLESYLVELGGCFSSRSIRIKKKNDHLYFRLSSSSSHSPLFFFFISGLLPVCLLSYIRKDEKCRKRNKTLAASPHPPSETFAINFQYARSSLFLAFHYTYSRFFFFINGRPCEPRAWPSLRRTLLRER